MIFLSNCILYNLTVKYSQLRSTLSALLVTHMSPFGVCQFHLVPVQEW